MQTYGVAISWNVTYVTTMSFFNKKSAPKLLERLK